MALTTGVIRLEAPAMSEAMLLTSMEKAVAVRAARVTMVEVYMVRSGRWKTRCLYRWRCLRRNSMRCCNKEIEMMT